VSAGDLAEVLEKVVLRGWRGRTVYQCRRRGISDRDGFHNSPQVSQRQYVESLMLLPVATTFAERQKGQIVGGSRGSVRSL
jgi:hypothetical protein